MSSLEQLNDEIHQQILNFSEAGDVCIDEDNFECAINNFREAFALIPQPFEDWEASIWILTSLGEAYFFNREYEQAHAALTKVMHVPGAIGNPLIHLRLGEVQFELGNNKRATDELLRAYMAEGAEIFDGEDVKYFNFLKDNADII